MPNVILYPVSNTTREKDQTADLLPHLDQETADRIRARAAGGPLRIYGRQSSDRKKWERVNEGDVVLFSSGGKVFRTGRVAYKDVISELAERLWPSEKNGGTWDHLIVVTGLRDADIPYAELNAVSGDSERYVPFGFRIMAPEKGARVLDKFFRD